MTTGHGLKQGDLGLPFPDNAQKALTGGFGPKHAGIDWALAPGTPICAMYDGKVENVADKRYVRGADPSELVGIALGYANFVRVSSTTDDGRFEAVYAHLSQVFVKKGQRVRKGDLLGLSGHTGWSSGPHVHVETRAPVWFGGTKFDFKDFLPPGYNIDTLAIIQPLAHNTGEALELRSQPNATLDPTGTLTAPTAAWSVIEDSAKPQVMQVGTVNDSGTFNKVNIGDPNIENDVNFAGKFTLSLEGNTVKLEIRATLPATGGRYLPVSSNTLPENLRPPVRTQQTTWPEVPTLEDPLVAGFYVSQDGRIFFWSKESEEAVSPDSLDTRTLTWQLAYSVLGKDGPAAGWWQIAVPGLDPAGEVGWVQDGVMVSVAHANQVRITWPPPPTRLEAIGTRSDPLAGQVQVDLSWEKPEDLWTGVEGITPAGGYRILRGSSPKTLGDHATTAASPWSESIRSNEAFFYAVAGAAGTGTSLRSLVDKVGTGSNTLSPQPPGPSIGTLKTKNGINVRSSPEVLNKDPDNRIGYIRAGQVVNVLGDNRDPEGNIPEATDLWWQIQWPGREAWVTGNTDHVTFNAHDAEGEIAVLPLGTGGMGGGGELHVNQPDPSGSEPVPSAGRLYARLGVAAGAAGDRLRAWPAQAATELAATLRADVWYEVRRLYAHTGLGDLWLEVAPHSAIPTGPATGPAGWVRLGRMGLAASGTPALPPSARFVRLRAWVTAGANVRSGPGKGFGRHTTLRDRASWHRLEGRNAEATWYRIEYAAGSLGWIYSGLVDVIEPVEIPLMDLPIRTVSHRPDPEPGPTGETGVTETGTTSTTGSAKGDFRNLETNPDGRWSVTKSGRTATLGFGGPRSPVQYYARQNPQPQFVLPEAFRPTATVERTVTGTEVDEHRRDLPGSPSVTFTVRVEPDGEVRYVDNSQVDHVGFVRYGVQGWSYATATTLEEPGDPEEPGDLEDSGTYHNRQVNWGSSWELEREGDAVEGCFATTRSPVDYFANTLREAQIWLPADFWPERDVRFEVTGAVRVDEFGTDSSDTRTVDFWITVQASDGRMYIDQDASLTTAGVGYLRYEVDVDWDAETRVTVPSAPRSLEAEDVEAEELRLAWDRPEEDGGASVDEYRVEVYRNGAWETEEDDISRTRHDVEGLDAHTRYSFRVLARNSEGWSEPSTAVTVTTPREAPGRPGQPAATATHAQVDLSWSAPAGSTPVTGYLIQRKVGSGSWETRVPNTRATTPGWTDRDVLAGTGYSYRVAADHYGVPGDWSSARSVHTAATPTVPGQATALAATPGATSRLELDWAEPGDTGGGVTGYRVERSPDEDPRAWATRVADTGSAATRWGDDAVAADTVVHYRVSACNSAGAGAASSEAAGQSRPQLRLPRQVRYPLTAHCEPRSDAAVTATFTAYQPGEAYELTGQVPGANGWWRVQLLDPAFAEAAWLPAAAGQATGATAALPQPPASPGDFTATLAGGETTLTWTAPATGATVTGYRLWRQVDTGTWVQLGSDLGATDLAATDDTVATGHVYRYRLQALSDEGPGVPTAVQSLAAMATPAAPAAVTALMATATTTTLALGWTRSATGGLPTGYRVAWREADTDDFYWEVAVTGTAYTVTNLIPGTAYELRVTAFNQEGAAAVTTGTGTTVQVAPGRPTPPAATVLSNRVTLTWQAGEAGGRPDEYHVQAKPQAAAAWPPTYDTVTAATHELTGLAYETAHDVRVRASNSAGQSDWAEAVFTTGAEIREAPGMPGGLTATVAAQTATLRWQAPTTGGPATAYQVQHKLRATPDWPAEAEAATVTGLRHALTGLTADAAYGVRVRASNPTGASAWVATDFTAGPEAPGEPVMVEVAVEAQTATVSWRVPTTGGTPAGYQVQHKLQATPDWPAEAEAATVTGLRHALTGLTAEAAYEVRVRASNVSGASAWVATDFTAGPEAPGEPVMVEVAVEAQTATVSWQVPTTGGTPAGYHVQHKLQTTPDWPAEADAATVTGLRHALTGLTADGAYDVRVRASNATGQSAWVAADFTAGPALPGVPGDLMVTAGGTTLALAWTAPTTGGAATGYRVQWRPATATLFEVATVAGPNHTLSGLKPATAYAVQVAATNASGAGPAATQSATTLQVAPGIPAALAATADTATSATVRWAAPATGGVPDEYHLQTRTQGAADWPPAHTVVSGLSHNLSGLTSGAAYDVRVRASNSAGPSEWVETDFTAEEPLPGVPTGVGTTYATANALGVGWTAPAGAPAAGHGEPAGGFPAVAGGLGGHGRGACQHGGAAGADHAGGGAGAGGHGPLPLRLGPGRHHGPGAGPLPPGVRDGRRPDAGGGEHAPLGAGGRAGAGYGLVGARVLRHGRRRPLLPPERLRQRHHPRRRVMAHPRARSRLRPGIWTGGESCLPPPFPALFPVSVFIGKELTPHGT